MSPDEGRANPGGRRSFSLLGSQRGNGRARGGHVFDSAEPLADARRAAIARLLAPRRLAEDGPDSARIRAAIGRTISGEPPKRGGILEALRRSPLVGADAGRRSEPVRDCNGQRKILFGHRGPQSVANITVS